MPCNPPPPCRTARASTGTISRPGQAAAMTLAATLSAASPKLGHDHGTVGDVAAEMRERQAASVLALAWLGLRDGQDLERAAARIGGGAQHIEILGEARKSWHRHGRRWSAPGPRRAGRNRPHSPHGHRLRRRRARPAARSPSSRRAGLSVRLRSRRGCARDCACGSSSGPAPARQVPSPSTWIAPPSSTRSPS